MAKNPEPEIEIDDPEFPDEMISFELNREGSETGELSPETTLDLLRQAEEEEYEDEIGRQTNDPAIQESLVERQELAAGGDQFQAIDAERTAVSPALSGGDVDAAWNQANVAGEEAVGGTVSTPDQDRVDEIGAAVGLEYEDDEPLDGAEKLHERDEHRWELEPESVEEEE